METRLQKYLLKAGVSTREDAINLIKESRVSVNGRVVKDLGFIVNTNDTVLIDGLEAKVMEDKVYYVLNKPRGYASTSSKNYKNIYSLLDGVDEDIYPIFDLDREATGLMILTNDKDYLNLVRNSESIEKEYSIRIKGLLRKAESDKITRGELEFNGEKAQGIKIFNVKYNEDRTSTSLTLTLTSEKPRLIKSLFESVSHEASYIRRNRIGNILLDIKDATYRRLKPFEIKQLRLLALTKATQSKKKRAKTTSIRVKREKLNENTN
ncbi:MAG: hypothetical protein K6G38_02000 [Gammaproteobacteria bacterium]|nr:hypothetical protein [Gammaproteobacteria bacterium]